MPTRCEPWPGNRQTATAPIRSVADARRSRTRAQPPRLDDLAPAIRPAMRARAMAQRRLAALRTGDDVRRGERVVRATLVALRSPRYGAWERPSRVSSVGAGSLAARERVQRRPGADRGPPPGSRTDRRSDSPRTAGRGPRQSSPQSGRVGRARIICSCDQRREVDLVAFVEAEREVVGTELWSPASRRRAASSTNDEGMVEREGVLLETARAGAEHRRRAASPSKKTSSPLR